MGKNIWKILFQIVLLSSLNLQFAISEEDPAVTRFREYLRIDTSPPNPKYDESIMWIKKQSQECGLEFHLHDLPDPAFFVVRLTWRGSNPNLKSIMLNSHIDVVPAGTEKWLHEPFEAFKEPNGDIYARGSQDRKSLGCVYLETVRRLKAENFVPLRTIHITFVPDEELGGYRGMKPFTESSEFKKLNIGFALDECEYGLLSYGERSLWQFNITATGKQTHALSMPENKDNAGAKLLYVMTKLFRYRNRQLMLLKKGSRTISDVTSINLSMIGGGIQANIVPPELWMVFDMRIRLRPSQVYAHYERFLNNTCTNAGPGVSYKFIVKNEISEETKVDDSNPWWTLMKSIHDKMEVPLKPGILPASSDARFIRKAGIPCFGYSTINNKEVRVHQINEYINEKAFLDGIQMFETVFKEVVNSPVDKN